MTRIILIVICFYLTTSSIYSKDLFERILYKSETLGLNCVDILNPQIALAVGDFGVVRYTRDSSETWQSVMLPEKIKLNAVTFIDSQNVICVGNEGIIYRSSNQGIDWSNISSNTGKDLMSVEFYNNLLGVITGKEGIILVTNDGGMNWKQKDSKTKNDLLSVSYGTKDTVFIAGIFATIMKSVDGGNSWELLNSPVSTTFEHIKAFGNKVYVMGDSITVLVSNDGGINWKKQLVEIDFENKYYKPRIAGFFFFDSLNALIRVSDMYAFSHYVYFTTDGGDYWWSQDLIYSGNADIPTNDYDFYSRDYGISVGVTGDIYFLKILNGKLGIRQITENFTVGFRKIAAINSNSIAVSYTGGSPSRIIMSSDSGNKWKETSRFDTIGRSRGVSLYSDFAFPGANTLIVAMNNQRDSIYRNGDTTYYYTFYYGFILNSTDNGNNWSEFVIPDSSQALKIDMANENYGLLQTNYLRYMRTTDGGSNWERMSIPDTTIFYISNIYCPKPNLHILIGTMRDKTKKLYISNDAGISWDSIITFPSDISSLLFLDSNKMFGFGSQKFENTNKYLDIIKESNDNGQTWVDLLTADTSYMKGCRIYDKFDDFNIAVTTGGQYFYKTKDSGKNWEKIDISLLEDNESIIDLAFLSPNELILTGTSGTMLRYKGGILSVEYKPEFLMNRIAMFPNPFDNCINLLINSELDASCNIEVIDLKGTIVIQKVESVSKGLNSIGFELNGLTNSLYLLKISIGDRTFIGKLIRE
ncbi:MAG: T9SS type A sorting domain-containing protein [Ignavibacteriae bacterium]|nr:T9SS type A sorting domain-containing protein [Ignavibacteriota bacterium]